ncbi:hypothetical protein K3495_g8752 [Podosphaera aphanis]|nr:hypothetical protein K3495_g8752 [Podosphaera aphanis]
MAVKAVNDTAGYNGLVPTLLVFGAFPRITATDSSTPSTMQRAAAIKAAMAETAKLHAARQVKDALRQRNGPQISQIHNAPIGSQVLVWRIHQKKWTGPFKLIAITDETCTIEMPSGPTNFRSTVVKPYLENNSSESNEAIILSDSEQQEVTSSENIPAERTSKIYPSHIRQPPARYRESNTQFADITLYLYDTNLSPIPNFKASRLKELNGLLDRGVFEIVDKNCIPKNARLFGSRFVDTVKNQGTEKAFEKSCLVVQAYNDNVKKTLLTQSPTIQRSSQRLALSLFVTLPDVNIYLRDISQAYTQSKSSLARDFFIRAPEEMGLPSNMVLEVVLPLYGIPEAGTHWFYTYQKHHIDKLNMKLSTFDPCLLFNENQSAIIGLQTDDSLIVATPSFMEIEEQKLTEANLLSKPIKKLGVDHPLEFNGFMITLNKSNNICITQKKQLEKIKLLGKDFTNEEYIAQRARGAYIATVSQPEASFCLSYAAQITNPTYDDAQFLNRCLKWQLQGRGLNFVKLDQQSLRLITFTDSSFANNRDNY